MGQIGGTSRPRGESPDISSSVRSLGPALLRAAWLSIGLGLLLEALLIALAIAFATDAGVKPFLAELTQKISWSVVVCVGLAIGVLASKAQPAFAGLMGLLAAPAGFEIARSLHRGAGEALQIAGANSSGSLRSSSPASRPPSTACSASASAGSAGGPWAPSERTSRLALPAG
jgi:hypothetical protein